VLDEIRIKIHLNPKIRFSSYYYLKAIANNISYLCEGEFTRL
jgi:hypothetical protein